MTTSIERRESKTLPFVPPIWPRTPPAAGPRRSPWAVLVLAALVIAAVIGFEVSSGAPTYPITAVFAKTPGLFAGAAVNLLGVKVGTVTSVRNVGDVVVVAMRLAEAQPIPSTAIASFESPALLGQPDIELSPGYAGGPRLTAGSVVSESHTTEPVSTDQVLKDLAKTLNALDPRAVGSLVANLAEDLNGEGASLHQLITGAAGTLQLLAAKGDDLGQLNGTLAQLTGSLDSRTSEIQSLITAYDTVSGVVAGHSTQLSEAITQLTAATTDLVNLLTPNLSALEQDVGTITTAGRTIDRNIPNIDEGLYQSVRLFSAAGRAYDPNYNWINLNNQVPPGVTGDYVAGLVRDRLAGICRRILANESTGLSTPEIATLTSCGNPNSGFFDPILSNVAGILSAVSAGTTPPSATPLSMLQQGMAQIPGLGSPSTGSTGSAGSGSAGSGSGSTGSSGSGGSGSGGSGSGGSGSGGSGSGGSGTGSSGGGCVLLIVCGVSSTPSGNPSAAPANEATYSVPAPSLVAKAAHLLPPMPKNGNTGMVVHHQRPHHRAGRHQPATAAEHHPDGVSS